MAVVRVTSRSTYRDEVDELWSEYARTRIATYTVMHRSDAGGRVERKVIADSAEPFCKQRVENTVRNARENAGRRTCQQSGGRTCLHGFYHTCRRVFRGSEVVNCAVLREVKLTSQDVLTHRFLNWKLHELDKEERSDGK